MRRALASMLLLLCSSASGATWKWTDPYPGIRHLTYTDGNVPVKAHVVTVDLTWQEIHLRATPTAERGRTVSEFATCKGAGQGCIASEVAVNGDLFRPLGFVPAGFAEGDRGIWSDASMDGAEEGWIAFGRPKMDLNAVALQRPDQVGNPPKALDADGAVGGRPLLVGDGIAIGQFDCNDASEPCRQKARSAVGLDMLGSMLYLAVVDGDQQGSVGMSAAELAAFLQGLGAWNALALDGGGASAMYIAGEGGLVSKPSDGVERPVANHLGVHYGALPHCTVVGFVFDKVLGGTKLTNATVSLDGRNGKWDMPHQLFSFTDVEPHKVCVVAKAPGFMTGQQCKQITLADIMQDSTQYCSVVLQPGNDPPDMARAPADMAAGPRDMARSNDRSIGGGDAADGGDVGPVVAGCACGVGGRRSGLGWASGMALLLLLLRRRERERERERETV